MVDPVHGGAEHLVLGINPKNEKVTIIVLLMSAILIFSISNIAIIKIQPEIFAGDELAKKFSVNL